MLRGEPLPIDPDGLLRQSAWVRRLARRLVRDDAAAEDLVQETWLAALRSAPRDEGRLRPWLARVMLNCARLARRGSANRTARERLSARPELTPSTSQTAERLEAQRLLVEALQALEEPYRTTVTLRWLDGLSSAEIARREGVPAGTVRWRLKKGMDDLRARLDKRMGGRPLGFAILLLPLLRRPPLGEIVAGSAAVTVQGVLAMNTLTKAGIAAAVAVTASVGMWMAIDPAVERPGPLAADVRASPPPDLEAPEDATPPQAEPAVLASEPAVERRESAAPRAADPAPTAAPGPARLEARFVDVRDAPVEGVRLALPGYPGSAPAVSGPDGRAALEVELSRASDSTEVEAARLGFATHFVRATLDRGKTTWLGDVRLEPGGAIAGRVLGPDGAPAPDADVMVTSPEMNRRLEEARARGPHGNGPSVRTRADGTFRIDGARAGLARVWAGGGDMRWSFTDPVEVPEGSLLDGVELRLEPLAPEDQIAGVVLSPEGEPVPGADVRYTGKLGGSTWSGSLGTGTDGRFRHRLPVRGPHDLTVRDREGRWPDASALAVQPGTLDLELRFPSPRWLEIRVRDSSGKPVEEYAVAIQSADRTRTLRAGKVEEHPEGTARVLLPSETFVVEVRARGHGSAILGPWSPDAAPASTSCTLERLAGVRGRVTADGAAVAGARVFLHEVAGPTTKIERNGFPMRLHPEPEDSATTDAEGWFQLDASRPGSAEGHRFYQRDPADPGTFALLCEADGYALAEVSPLEIDPAVGMDGIEIALVRGGAIEGRVKTAPGKDPAGVIAAVDRADGRPRTQRVGPDGEFRFEHLTPGRWNLARSEVEARGGGGSTSWSSGGKVKPEFPWTCVVEDGRTTRADLDLTDDALCVLLAQVSVNGLPAFGWTARLLPTGGSTTKKWPAGAVDAQGRLRLEVADPGDCRLDLSPPPEQQPDARFSLPIALHRGDNTLPLDLRLGTVRGRCTGPLADASIFYQAGEHGTLTCHATVKPDADGRFELRLVLAGRARVGRMRIREDGATVGPVAEVQVQVPAGGTVEVEAP